MIIRIVHGFLEGQESDQAGLHALIADLKKIYPTALITEHTQDKFADETPFVSPESGPEICIGNSWGASAIIRRMDKNPTQMIDLAILLDPVPNEFNEPKQTADKKEGWHRRQNIHHVLVFRETESVLKGTGLAPGNLEMFTGQKDWANGFMLYEYGWGTEAILDWDPKTGPLGDFMAHFHILTQHAWVRQLMMERIARAT